MSEREMLERIQLLEARVKELEGEMLSCLAALASLVDKKADTMDSAVKALIEKRRKKIGAAPKKTTASA